MSDHLHVYNVKVAAARTAHREAVRRASDEYDVAISPLLAIYNYNVDLAARIYRDAMADAEDTYQQAITGAETEPPF